MIKNKEKFNEPEIRQVSITEVETKINEVDRLKVIKNNKKKFMLLL